MRTQVGRRLKAELLWRWRLWWNPTHRKVGRKVRNEYEQGVTTQAPVSPRHNGVKRVLDRDPVSTVTKVTNQRLKPLKLIPEPCTLPRETIEKQKTWKLPHKAP